MSYDNIPQTPVAPDRLRKIVSIGAGGIVKDAHYPAYRIAGYDVIGIYDLEIDKAKALTNTFDVGTVYESISQATEQTAANVIYDVAVPASSLLDVLPQLPDGSALLMQKPMGNNLSEALQIRDLCEKKRFTSAVNFQMRYAPFSIAARHLIDTGVIGDLHSMEFRVTVHTPWSLWSFLEGIPRLEILYHSIHYIDLTRHFLGDPSGVFAKTTQHPENPNLAATRTAMILDYGNHMSSNIVTNHGHLHGRKHQESYIRREGTRGAIRAQMGVLLDYPTGEADILEVTVDGSEWNEVPLQGTWFPHAFIGTLGSVIRAANGEIDRAATDVTDAYRTMAVVEAAYQSSESGATTIPY